MRTYYRVMLGKGSRWADECFAGGFIGADFEIAVDLTDRLPDQWRTFNKEFIPIYLEGHPEKTKIGAGLACGFLWNVCKGMETGDVVLSPDGTGRYRVGEITGDYFYQPGGFLPHRRPVRWLNKFIDRTDMSQGLRNSTGSIGTVSNITRSGFAEEVEGLIEGIRQPTLVSTDDTVEDPAAFAMEKHLEDFLVENWAQTELGGQYDIYEEDGERVGQQFPTDTGPMDILATSKDKTSLLVVELKKGRASDHVVGQLLRYMGYVKEELLEEGQEVRGVVIAREDDPRLKRALSIVPDIGFYRYEVSFRLVRM